MRIPHIPFLSIIFCYCFWIHHSVDIISVAGQVVDDQQQSLLKLKNDLQFKHEKSLKLVSWIPSTDCCEWMGLACDVEGHVIGLDLSGESISGGFDNSSSLFNLQNLKILNLSANNFSSEIPSGFNKLKNLTYLNLSHAGFVGQIPIEISYLTRLVTLDISSLSYLYGQPLKLENLQMLVQNMTRLRQLYMDGVIVTAQGSEWCNALLHLVGLQELSMSNCNLSGPLDPSLTRLKNLSIIRLDQNNLSSLVPGTFADFRNLTTLHLSFCGLTGTFPEKIFRVATLSDIDLSFNYDLYGSLPEFPQNGSLQTLIVQNTNFSGEIPASISSLRLLSILDLSNCNFNGTLPSSMSRLRELTYLDLSFNYFTGPIPSLNMSRNLMDLDVSHNVFTGSIISVHLEGLTNLVHINLQDNLLNGRIPSSLFSLPPLQSIRLSDNNFQDLLSSFPEMGSVELASCNLTEFPSFLRSQPQISTLDLSSNHIQGSIPTWIWQLDTLVELNLSLNLLNNLEVPVRNISSNLRLLDLHSNQLQGKLPIFPANIIYLDYSSNNFSFTVPSDVGIYLSSIIFLSLSKNNLSGSIPESLCNSPNLLVLDVSYNHFNEIIPECLTQSDTLAILNLQHNKFNGSIPDKFPVSCALRTLDLNSNLLQGTIPKSLANCTSLEVLDLGNNEVDDGFPYILETISTLRVLILRGNKFHGHIECSHINSTWHMLQIVDLAFNNFSGSLPLKCFKTWKAMMLNEDHDGSKLDRIGSVVLTFGGIYYQDSVILTTKGLQLEFVKVLYLITSVDFSSNDFHGTIPEELMNLTRLIFLNLSHNALAGQIPSSISNLKQLESLDLSSNYLDGEIPTSLTSLSFLSYMNLSFNRLVGKIPSGTQLQSFDASSFTGNVELCGAPLIKNCSDDGTHGLSMSPHERADAIDWNIMSAEWGFDFGLALVIIPLLFWKKWRQWYWQHVNCILCRIFPQLNVEYETRGGQSYQVLRWMH